MAALLPTRHATRRRVVTRVAAVVGASAIALGAVVVAAAAQTVTCSEDGAPLASVRIVSPQPRDRVRGKTDVVVRGRASVALDRAELWVGEELQHAVITTDPSRLFDVTLYWAAGGHAPGDATIRVVVCARDAGVWGAATVTVEVRSVADRLRPRPERSPPPVPTGLPTVISTPPPTGESAPLWPGIAVVGGGLLGIVYALIPRRGERGRPH